MVSNLDNERVDLSDDSDFDSADDSEVERELEERIRQAQEAGRDKIFEDVSDAHSVMSMGNQTMSNMQFNVPLDVDLDNLIDELVANQNPAHLAELERERNEQLQFIRDQN